MTNPPHMVEGEIPGAAVEALGESLRSQGWVFPPPTVAARALQAALPHLRQSIEEEVRERLLKRVAETSAAPANIVLTAGYDRGRADERATWTAALSSASIGTGEK